ncbi:MAG: hypothetical protein CMJ94_05515 [Planctomycetes bacterium]|nr:hypothetical protein [Planctomycetota bacterium]
MTPLLALLPLLVPAQTAQQSAVDFLPQDTFVAIEISAEPWQRLGDQAAVSQLFQQQPMADMFTPMKAEIDVALAQASAQMGFDLGSLLTGSRLYVAVPFALLENQGQGQLVFAADLPPAIAEGVNLGQMLDSFGQGAWWQEGTVLLGTVQPDELETADRRLQGGFETGVFEPSPARGEDADYLAGLIDAGRKGAGLSGRPTFATMAAKARSANDLMGIWLMVEHIDREFIEMVGEEELPEGIEQLAERAGISKLGGVGYSFSVSPPMLEDRFVFAGEGFGAGLFPPDLLELVDLRGLLSALPHDAVQVQLSAMDYSALGDMLEGLLDFALSISGEEMPAEVQPMADAVWLALDSIGPVAAGVTRIDDFDRGNPGEAWIQVRNKEGLEEALSVIPQEVFDGISSAMQMSPGAPQLKLAMQGERFVFIESLGQPTTERLLTQAEFQPSADWLRQFPANQIAGIEFVHRDLIVEGFDLMRERGDDMLSMMGEGLPVSFEMLPEPVVMRAILRPMTGVILSDGQGVTSVTRSPLGAMPTRMLVALPTLMNMVEAMGMGFSSQFDEEEF